MDDFLAAKAQVRWDFISNCQINAASFGQNRIACHIVLAMNLFVNTINENVLVG